VAGAALSMATLAHGDSRGGGNGSLPLGLMTTGEKTVAATWRLRAVPSSGVGLKCGWGLNGSL